MKTLSPATRNQSRINSISAFFTPAWREPPATILTPPAPLRISRKKDTTTGHLGHVHQPEILSENPWIVFPGNIQGRHARECGERGCAIVTVNDSLEVTSFDRHPLDLVRWVSEEININDAEDLPAVFSKVRAILAKALENAQDRLLAARITLTGTTPLHGLLCSHPERIDAEIEACAQDFGEGRIWIERVKRSTRPAVKLEDLAARDALTATVVEALTESRAPGTVSLPDEVTAMLEILPTDLATTLRDDWTGTDHPALLEDACSMILERLLEKGAES